MSAIMKLSTPKLGLMYSYLETQDITTVHVWTLPWSSYVGEHTPTSEEVDFDSEQVN